MKVKVKYRHGRKTKTTVHHDVVAIKKYPSMIAVEYVDQDRGTGVSTWYHMRDRLVSVKIKEVV